MRSEREIYRRTIWKFQLPESAEAMEVKMPMGAEVCTFQYQNGVPCIWAIVDPDIMRDIRRFRIFGTGHPLPAIDQCCYVGTAQDGLFIWHLFEMLDSGQNGTAPQP